MTPRYMQAFFNGRMPSLPSLDEAAAILAEANAHVRNEWQPPAPAGEGSKPDRATVVNLRRRLALV